MDTLDQIKTLAAANNDVSVLWLYGSRAKGNHRLDSDYDLAIAFHNFNVTDIEKSRRPHETASDWMAALNLNEGGLSIVDIDHCALYLRFDIINEGKVIYAKDKKRQFQEEAKISALFEHETLARPKTFEKEQLHR